MNTKRLSPINDYERSVLKNVKKFGWHCTSVFSREGDDRARFSYTVGLYESYNSPEFIIFGLDSEIAHSLLSILSEAAEDGQMYSLDKPCDKIIQGYECIFVEVPKQMYNDYVFSALWYNAGDSFPLYQVVWPDSNGNYPWNESYISEAGYEQPVLGSKSA